MSVGRAPTWGGFSVLKGERVTLRPIREADLDTFWLLHTDIANRGPYYPRGVLSEPTFRKQFAETGFWTREEGTLLITTGDGRIVGSIEFFPTVRYLSEVELSYQLFDRADDGQGYVSEAVGLLVRYLFENKALNRIRLIIHPGNAGSQRVAEKNGFQREGVMRGAFLSGGRYQDVQLWSIVHDDVIDGDGA
ncbi:MAG TPA: GNAT family protein [Candidatus Limnocylindrales bacterium]|jgi:[ribosomal protein S5]-alanine N-acetyltransferase|nr:GNAT family protein [Candidatus Limnocylindrales bacterium]